jgi:hypothetical protein
VGHVVALFVSPDGPYPRLVGASRCYDEARDARTYEGEHPVVAHPPCQLWVNFAFLNYKRWGGEHNRPGNDGECFRFALSTVRRVAGVVEHPAFSHAWEAHALTAPRQVGWIRTSATEWVCEVWQSAYGHKARKRTWLLYVSPWQHPPWELVWERHAGTHQIGFHDDRGKARNKPTVSKKEAIHSPPAFAEVLIALAHRAAYGR